MPSYEHTFLDLAEIAIRRARRPLTAAEIVERVGTPRGSVGRTPLKTLAAALSRNCAREDDSSCFERVSRGKYQLREKR